MKQFISRDSPSRPLALLARPTVWIALAAAFLAVDYVAGPTIQFPITFVFPVALAAWHRGFRWSMGLAVAQPLVRFSFHLAWDPPWALSVSVVNLLIRIIVLCGFAWLVAHTVWQRHRIAALERLLPVCAWCKRIRTEENFWQPLDAYLSRQARLDVTHGICPDCLRKQMAGAGSDKIFPGVAA
jgi:hypothetical protein